MRYHKMTKSKFDGFFVLSVHSDYDNRLTYQHNGGCQIPKLALTATIQSIRDYVLSDVIAQISFAEIVFRLSVPAKLTDDVCDAHACYCDAEDATADHSTGLDEVAGNLVARKPVRTDAVIICPLDIVILSPLYE